MSEDKVIAVKMAHWQAVAIYEELPILEKDHINILRSIYNMDGMTARKTLEAVNDLGRILYEVSTCMEGLKASLTAIWLEILIAYGDEG